MSGCSALRPALSNSFGEHHDHGACVVFAWRSALRVVEKCVGLVAHCGVEEVFGCAVKAMGRTGARPSAR
eukprot:959280-Rhodomonas_salina.1